MTTDLENKSGADNKTGQSSQAGKLDALIADLDFSDVPESIRDAVIKATAGKVKLYDSSYRAKTEDADKAAKKQAAAKQKAVFTPVAPTTAEDQDRKEQATPLGLNGDTATKKKPVKVKGASKERLQNKPVTPPPPGPPPDPTVNPSLGATPEGVTPSPVPTPHGTAPAPAQQPEPSAPTPQPNN